MQSRSWPLDLHTSSQVVRWLFSGLRTCHSGVYNRRQRYSLSSLPAARTRRTLQLRRAWSRSMLPTLDPPNDFLAIYGFMFHCGDWRSWTSSVVRVEHSCWTGMAAMTGSLGRLAFESVFTAAISVFGRLATWIWVHVVMVRHGILARSLFSDSERSTRRHQYSRRYKGEVESRWDDFAKQGCTVLHSQGDSSGRL